MKYVFSLLFAGISLVTLAQNNGHPMRNKSMDFTPDQIASLQTKKMALALDLNASQQNQLLAINKKQAETRKNKMEERKAMKQSGQKLTSDEKYKMMEEMLDLQLARQKEMKKVLNDKQYEIWKKSQETNRSKMHKKRAASKRHKAAGKNKMNKN